MSKQWLTRLGMVNGLSLAAALLLSRLTRSELIIRVGIKAADVLLPAAWIVLGLLWLAGNVWQIVSLARRRRRIAASTVRLHFSESELEKPENVRTELTCFSEKLPKLKPLLTQGLEQMDSMDRKQEKLVEIQRRNDLSFLDEVSKALDLTEKSLCKNMLRVLNWAILWDRKEEDKADKKTLFEERKGQIQKRLDKNDQLLTLCDTLLSETVSLIEEKQAGGMDSVLNLEVTREVIEKLRKLTGNKENEGGPFA